MILSETLIALLRIKAEMEEKMKTMTRKERKNYMKKMQLEADLRAIEEKTATMGRWCGHQRDCLWVKILGSLTEPLSSTSP